MIPSLDRKPVIYIAGPYSASTKAKVVRNVEKAIHIGNRVLDMGLCAYVPHLSFYMDPDEERGWDFWISSLLSILSRATAVLRMPGASRGADIEVAYAVGAGIPVFSSLSDLAEHFQIPLPAGGGQQETTDVDEK